MLSMCNPVPCARVAVQCRQFFLVPAGLQTLLQQLLEQVMVAIPALPIVEGNQKKVGALQPVQDGLHLFWRDCTIHDCGTRLCAELIEYGRAFEKLLYRMGLLCEDFPDQVTA